MSNLNKTQIGGDHYKDTDIEHWDFAFVNDLDYFQGCITKYVIRWKKKGGIQDLEKASHFLAKYIELESRLESNKDQPSLFPSTVGELEDTNRANAKQQIIDDYKSIGMKNPYGYDEEEDNAPG